MKRKIQALLGLIIGVFLIWYLFRRTDWREVHHAILNVNLFWLTAAQLAVLLTFVTRILRWRYVVRTAKPVSFRTMLSATQIGFLANFTLPGRVGEVVRALVLSRLAGIPFTKCFAFVTLDRVTDLVGLIAVLLVSIIGFRPKGALQLPSEIYERPIPPDLIEKGATGTMTFLFIIVGTLVLLYLKQQLVIRVTEALLSVLSKNLATRIGEMLQHFSDGLHIFRAGQDILKSLFFSLITWGLFLISFLFLFNAFDLEWPWYSLFVVQSALALAISLPGAPGFVGQYHFAVAVAMVGTMPTLDFDVAKALSIVAHLMNVIPIGAMGVYFLYSDKIWPAPATQED